MREVAPPLCNHTKSKQFNAPIVVEDELEGAQNVEFLGAKEAN